jgi:hypothetical protein
VFNKQLYFNNISTWKKNVVMNLKIEMLLASLPLLLAILSFMVRGSGFLFEILQSYPN